MELTYFIIIIVAFLLLMAALYTNRDDRTTGVPMSIPGDGIVQDERMFRKHVVSQIMDGMKSPTIETRTFVNHRGHAFQVGKDCALGRTLPKRGVEVWFGNKPVRKNMRNVYRTTISTR